ncbi:hypothetical protein L211DRAFT_851085 [Terfezia boudieri ATCC MYA-4762]|uniref:Uncharacterized protein n=1 Tax=Terfezia boudieri ATCC MYA-4762 TaxID=1051890 RepID=A0A3N4LV09_9PEZI|nr:hypothetical protein L211DRAFT_851085 [Terfezia boudieri ATCC MYA-4762]
MTDRDSNETRYKTLREEGKHSVKDVQAVQAIQAIQAMQAMQAIQAVQGVQAIRPSRLLQAGRIQAAIILARPGPPLRLVPEPNTDIMRKFKTPGQAVRIGGSFYRNPPSHQRRIPAYAWWAVTTSQNPTCSQNPSHSHIHHHGIQAGSNSPGIN